MKTAMTLLALLAFSTALSAVTVSPCARTTLDLLAGTECQDGRFNLTFGPYTGTGTAPLNASHITFTPDGLGMFYLGGGWTVNNSISGGILNFTVSTVDGSAIGKWNLSLGTYSFVGNQNSIDIYEHDSCSTNIGNGNQNSYCYISGNSATLQEDITIDDHNGGTIWLDGFGQGQDPVPELPSWLLILTGLPLFKLHQKYVVSRNGVSRILG